MDDIRDALRRHQAWRAFAVNDVTQRYRRALLGRLWIIVAMAITVAAVGSVYASVMQIPASGYVPFIAAGLVVWYLISAVVIEATSVFAAAGGLIKSIYLPKTFFILRLLYRNIAIFCTNLVVFVLSIIVFPQEGIGGLLMLPVSALLIVVNLFWMALLISVLSIRFRDFPPLIISAIQVLFLITPIIYLPSQLGDGLTWLSYLNPFASLVSILRDPLLGQWPGAVPLLICTGMAVVGSCVALMVFARSRSMIVLWL